MSREIRWERRSYESRIDLAADDISDFVDAVLATIDENAARSSNAQWEIVCRFFAGSAFAAEQQRGTEREGGRLIAQFFKTTFDFRSTGSGHGFNDEFEQLEYSQSDAVFRDGFDEFMDWLSNPTQFSPEALRARLASEG